MTAKLASIGIAIAVFTLLSACAGDDTDLGVADGLPADADGADVYEARCASCHGADLRGTDKGPSPLSIVYEPGHHGDDSYRSAIRNGARQHHWGFGDMPAVTDITDEQIETVISYIRGNQQRLGFDQ